MSLLVPDRAPPGAAARNTVHSLAASSSKDVAPPSPRSGPPPPGSGRRHWIRLFPAPCRVVVALRPAPPWSLDPAAAASIRPSPALIWIQRFSNDHGQLRRNSPPKLPDMAKVMAEVKRPMPPRGGGRRRSFAVGVDYLRHLSPAWHGSLRPTLWAALALATAVRSPFYDRWDVELRAAPRFLAALAFMLAVFLCEAIFVRFVRLHHARPPVAPVGSFSITGGVVVSLRHYYLTYSCTNVRSGYTYDGVYFVLSA
jgi:hypothetical protein